MYLILLFFIAVLAGGVQANGACQNENYINRTSTDEYYFPADWNENESPPGQAAGQGCSWNINIPQGYYVKLIINGHLYDNHSNFEIYDYYGNVEFFKNNDGTKPYFLVGPKFLLSIENESAASYGFKVEWLKFPQGIDYNAGIGGVPQVINITKDVLTAEFSAVTGISLLAFPADLNNIDTLRSTLVFEGRDYNGKFVGSLYHLYLKSNQYLSSGQMIYVVNVQARYVMDQLLIQEAGYTKGITAYEGLNCPPSSTCRKPLQPGNPKSGFVYIGNQTQTLTAITMDKTSALSVYYGGITNAGFYKTYTGSTIQSLLPLTFSPGITQYIISGGRTSFTFQFSD